MKPYEIWLRGSGGSLYGTMPPETFQQIVDEMLNGTCNIVSFEDGDGQTVIVRPVEIAAIAFGDK